MDILSRAQCLELLDRFEMPHHIQRHSFLVAEVSLFVGALLNQNSCRLDLRLVETAALLHDIGKMRSFQTREDHAILGAKMLDGMVHPAIARIVAEHIFLDSSQVDGPITESLLVNYSDKRVKHDQVVSVEDRYQDLITRYAKSPTHRQFLLDKLSLYRELEKSIFSHLRIKPGAMEIMGLTIDNNNGAGSENHGNQKTHSCVTVGRQIR